MQLKNDGASCEQYTFGNMAFYQAFFVLLWSSGAIVIVLGLQYTNPFTFLFYRLSLSAFLMLIISLITRAPWPKDWHCLKKISLTGLFMQFGYVTTYFCALNYGISPTVMTIILGLQPILTAVIFSLILKHSIPIYQYLGLLLGLCGVVLTVAYDLNTQAMNFIGLIFAVLCVTSITIGSVIQKNNPLMDLRTGTCIQLTVSIIPVLILNVFFGSFHFPTASGFIIALGWMVLVISVGATCLYYKLLREGNAVSINSLFYLIPVVTAVLCYFIFGTAFHLYAILGIIFIVGGILTTK